MRLDDGTWLVDGLRAGESHAQQVFWHAFWERTYRICLRILGKDPDATDIALDLMTDFVERHVKNLSDPRAVWSYLRLMAIRQSLETKKKWDRAAPLDFEIEDTKSSTPETGAMVSYLSPRLDGCLKRLTPKAQSALRLKYTRELTHDEIGRRIGGSKQYIGRLVRKSLDALRNCLEKQRTDTVGSRGHAMGGDTLTAITSETVARLLANRPLHESDQHGPRLAQLALVVSGVASPELVEEMDRHLVECRICREILLSYHRHEDDRLPAALAPNLMPPRSKRETVRRFVLPAAAVLIAGLGILFTALEDDSPQAPAIMRVKGFDDELIVSVKRGTGRFTLNPNDELRDGDRLNLVYSAARRGHLVVVSRDASGEVLALHPTSGTQSAPIFAGDRITLKDGAVVDAGQGCEWIIAVFSDTPLSVKSILDVVADAQPSLDTCDLELNIPSARTVRVYPVTRQGKR